MLFAVAVSISYCKLFFHDAVGGSGNLTCFFTASNGWLLYYLLYLQTFHIIALGHLSFFNSSVICLDFKMLENSENCQTQVPKIEDILFL